MVVESIGRSDRHRLLSRHDLRTVDGICDRFRHRCTVPSHLRTLHVRPWLVVERWDCWTTPTKNTALCCWPSCIKPGHARDRLNVVSLSIDHWCELRSYLALFATDPAERHPTIKALQTHRKAALDSITLTGRRCARYWTTPFRTWSAAPYGRTRPRREERIRKGRLCRGDSFRKLVLQLAVKAQQVLPNVGVCRPLS